MKSAIRVPYCNLVNPAHGAPQYCTSHRVPTRGCILCGLPLVYFIRAVNFATGWRTSAPTWFFFFNSQDCHRPHTDHQAMDTSDDIRCCKLGVYNLCFCRHLLVPLPQSCFSVLPSFNPFVGEVMSLYEALAHCAIAYQLSGVSNVL